MVREPLEAVEVGGVTLSSVRGYEGDLVAAQRPQGVRIALLLNCGC